MGIALTPSEVVERLIQDRQLSRHTEPQTKANNRLRLTVDDLIIGWDLEPEVDDD